MSKNVDVSLKCVDKNTGITLFELTTEDQTLNGLRESAAIGNETPKQKKLDDSSDVLNEHIEELLKPDLDDSADLPTDYTNRETKCINTLRVLFGDHEMRNFCLYNCFKYLWRCGLKNTEHHDVEKALWYFDKFKMFSRFALIEDDEAFLDEIAEDEWWDE